MIPTALRSGFLTPCHDQLRTAVMCELFACADHDFLNKFSVAGELDRLKVSHVGRFATLVGVVQFSTGWVR